MPFAIGENVGPYRVVEQLGQGGMATVYKAYHASLDRYVALKVMHPAFSEDPSFLARFRREARVVAKLDHPNIVPIFDFAEHEGSPYLVMKFIEGETLKARLARGPLTRDEGLPIVDAVGEALSYAHGRGILHRDIKPSNVLLSPDGSVYLADFGLARIAGAGESTLSGDMLLGTPQYISPEQARGDRDLDPGTDIYSLGVVLYELVVGRVPFNADTPFSIIHDHIYTPLPMPQAINPNVPEAVQRVLLKALAKERVDRYATVEDLVHAFNDALKPGRPLAEADTKAIPVTPAAAPAEIGVISAEASPPAPSKVSAPQPEEQPASVPRRSRRWIWIVGGLLIACGCLAAFAAIASNINRRNLANSTQSSGTAPAGPTVTVDPNDPAGWASRAQSDLAGGRTAEASAEFRRAGDLWLQGRAYVRAASVYLDSIQASGGPTAADPRLVQSATQALFFAAGEAGGAQVVGRAQSLFPDWKILPSLHARAQLAAGDATAAKASIDQATSVDSNDPLANAVLVEWNARQGNREAAQQVATKTLGMPNLPAWVVDFINSILKRIGASG